MKTWLKNQVKELYPGVDFDVLIPPDEKLGDYSINLPFVLAKKQNKNPLEVGKELAAEFNENREFNKYFGKIEPAGAGFINFYLSPEFLKSQLVKIIEEKENYGNGEDKKFSINLEFVSANPTGPITVHNIRAAPYGDTLAGILKKAGYRVTKEYYINDAGNQVRLLGESVARRYLRLKGKEIEFPENLYQGDYVIDIAKEIEKDGLAGNIENFDELVSICREYTVTKLVDSIKSSLNDLGVEFDVWFSEKTLHQKGEIENALKVLEKGNHVYEKDGAQWLELPSEGAMPPSDARSVELAASPEKQGAVLVKSDGSYSYLMGDIAYTRNKFIRGFNKAINIWGTDHHGDVIRLKTGVKSLTYDENKLEILLHQLVLIKKKDEVQRMSKRKGEFVLLDELLKEVGKDAIRFFFLMKDLNTHMEFDVDLAKEQSKKNPVYYIQYAYARLNSIFEKLLITNYKLRITEGDFGLLKEPEEIRLMRKLSKFPELVEDIAENYQVHHLAQYAYDLASDFHNFYEKHHVAQDDKKLQKARVALCVAISIILGNCLNLMGLSAPKKM